MRLHSIDGIVAAQIDAHFYAQCPIFAKVSGVDDVSFSDRYFGLAIEIP